MKAFPRIWLLTVFVFAALTPAYCSALSLRRIPCDVGDGYFLDATESEKGWHIFHESGEQKTACYYTADEEGFLPGWRPEYDFDGNWIYISDTIHEPKYVEIVSADENSPEEQTPERRFVERRKSRHVYFLFNKETREMTGPMTQKEFFEHPAVIDKNFQWKQSDCRDSSGVGSFFLMVFLFVIIFPAAFLTVVLYLLLRLSFLLFYGTAKTRQLAEEFGNAKPPANPANDYVETDNPYQSPE